jgi:hypothetical protein
MEEAIKRAILKMKQEKINNIRFVIFYFDYLLKISQEMNIEIGSYNEAMKHIEDSVPNVLIYQEACIWKLQLRDKE